MKRIALLICALSIAGLSIAQDSEEKVSVDRSKLQFNLGVGYSTWGLPLFAGIDFWITEDITIGLEASARLHLFPSYANFGGVINGNYHFAKLLDLPPEIDLYAGVSTGPYYSTYSGWSRHFRFSFAGQIGGRYYFNDKMAVMIEAGGGTLSGGKVGITVRL
ncbi:MAG: hypothetical protein V2A67_00540 [Bacteroidota bacterium]